MSLDSVHFSGEYGKSPLNLLFIDLLVKLE